MKKRHNRVIFPTKKERIRAEIGKDIVVGIIILVALIMILYPLFVVE